MSIMENAKMGAMISHSMAESRYKNAQVENLDRAYRLDRDLYKLSRQELGLKVRHLYDQAYEDDRRYQLDRDSFELKSKREQTYRELLNAQITYQLHANGIYYRLQQTSSTGRSMTTEFIEALQQIGSGNLRELADAAGVEIMDAIRDVLSNIPDVPAEVRDNIITRILNMGGPLGRLINTVRR